MTLGSRRTERKLSDVYDNDSIYQKLLKDEQIKGYNLKVKVTGLDHKSREESTNELDVHAAYLKMINIPCMFDIGTTPVNPCD